MSARLSASSARQGRKLKNPRGKAFFSSLLSERGLSRTQSRIEILKVLDLSSKPLSIVEILHTFKNKNRPDPTTLYRSLEHLNKAKLIQAVDLGDRVSRYELMNAKNNHHHHHVSCRKCGNVQCAPICLPQTVIDEIKKLGFKDVTHQLSFQGLCPLCAG